MLAAVQESVRSLLETSVNKHLPGANWRPPLPWVFGSQQYGLSGASSDIDLLVLAPAAVV